MVYGDKTLDLLDIHKGHRAPTSRGVLTSDVFSSELRIVFFDTVGKKDPNIIRNPKYIAFLNNCISMPA